MQDSIFTKIIKREIPAEIIYEDEKAIVILDLFPNTEGQSLVISKEQVDYIFDLDTETYHHLFDVAEKVSRALDKTFGALRTCIVVEGFEVPHAHLRLYPRTERSLTLAAGEKLSDEKLKELGTRIRANL